MTVSKSTTYRDAGVNIDAGDELVERIKPLANKTRTNKHHGLGGFGALTPIDLERFPEPVLVSGTDGVGTKLKLAIASNQHSTIGIDLVAMCANDILVCGAEPLIFLDYYATGALRLDQAEAIIGGIAEGCIRAGLELAGGETAEMPGMYHGGDYDLAGFAVGCVNKSAIIDGQRVEAGDAIVAIESSGAHSNGYSLIRRVLSDQNLALDSERSLSFLTPTHIYCKAIIDALHQSCDIRAMAHVTGGGLPGNVARSLPGGITAEIDGSTWTWPECFSWLQEHGNIATDEMYRTFNCGVGFTVVVPDAEVSNLISLLNAHGYNAWQCGSCVANNSDDARVALENG